MRVLFASTAGTGHFGPLVPFAHALREAGHEVAVAAPESFADAVTGAALDHLPFADAPADQMGATFGRVVSMTPEQADRVVVTDVFGRLDAQAALPGISATIGAWGPDLVVREPAELGSLAAAELAGVPHACVAIGMTAELPELHVLLTDPLAELDAIVGLDEGRCGAAMVTAEILSSVPAVLDAVPAGSPWEVHRFRVDQVGGTARLPAPWGDPAVPLVYVTFGSVAAGLAPVQDVYRAALGALADAPCRVLLTTGSGIDADTLGPVPANTHVERWWPQADVMPAAAAIVGHGGFGTTMAAVAHGVPQVVMPLFSLDQRLNAQHVADAGAGVWLDGGLAAVERLPDAVAQVLGTPSYGDAAARLAAAVADLPPLDEAVALLESIGRDRT